jgi:hypothetical protein
LLYLFVVIDEQFSASHYEYQGEPEVDCRSQIRDGYTIKSASGHQEEDDQEVGEIYEETGLQEPLQLVTE